MLVTLLNYFTIIAAETVIDIVMNFLALAVIAELDDFFFIAHGENELGKKMVLNEDKEYTDLYKIETTTSKDAEEYFIGHDRNNKPDPDLADVNLFTLRKDARLYIRYEQGEDEPFFDRLKMVDGDHPDASEDDKKAIKEEIWREKLLPGMDKHIAVRKENRTWGNYVFRMIYFYFYRSVYVVIWFYFLPVFMMMLQFAFSNKAINADDSGVVEA